MYFTYQKFIDKHLGTRDIDEIEDTFLLVKDSNCTPKIWRNKEAQRRARGAGGEKK